MTSIRITKKPGRASSNSRYEDWPPFRTFEDLALLELPEGALSAASELLGIKNDKAKDQLGERLQFAIRDYWVKHRAVVERPPAGWSRSKIEAIRKATDDLLALIREPTRTGLWQLRFETSRLMGRNLRGGPESIEQILEYLSAACQRCRFSAQRGAIAYTHLGSTIAELADIWTKYSKRPFTRNFKTVDNRRYKYGRLIAAAGHADAFVARGPRFVQIMMQRIDPTVPLSRIRTALRTSAVERRSRAENLHHFERNSAPEFTCGRRQRVRRSFTPAVAEHG
jgi:hypothetical protein